MSEERNQRDLRAAFDVLQMSMPEGVYRMLVDRFNTVRDYIKVMESDIARLTRERDEAVAVAQDKGLDACPEWMRYVVSERTYIAWALSAHCGCVGNQSQRVAFHRAPVVHLQECHAGRLARLVGGIAETDRQVEAAWDAALVEDRYLRSNPVLVMPVDDTPLEMGAGVITYTSRAPPIWIEPVPTVAEIMLGGTRLRALLDQQREQDGVIEALRRRVRAGDRSGVLPSPVLRGGNERPISAMEARELDLRRDERHVLVRCPHCDGRGATVIRIPATSAGTSIWGGCDTCDGTGALLEGGIPLPNPMLSAG